MAFKSFCCQGVLFILCFESCDANVFFCDDSGDTTNCKQIRVPVCASCEFDGDTQRNLDQANDIEFQFHSISGN